MTTGRSARNLHPNRNFVEFSSLIRHRVPTFGEAPDYGIDTRLQSVYLAEGMCNGDQFGAVIFASNHLEPEVEMYGKVQFEYHEKSTVGVLAMMTRPEKVECVEHPEIVTPEQALALAEGMRSHARDFYSGKKVLLDVPFRDKDRAKALGARWSPEERRWHVMSGLVDINDFAEWMPSPMHSEAPGM